MMLYILIMLHMNINFICLSLFLLLMAFLTIMVGLMHTRNMKPATSVAIVSVMRNPVDLPFWLDYHRRLGISHFFLRIEDGYTLLQHYLASQTDVTVQEGTSSTRGDNYNQVMTRQERFVNSIMSLLLRSNTKRIKWLVHIDSDELLHGDLAYLSDLPDSIKCIRLENVEAVYSDKHEKTDACFSSRKFIRCKLPGAQCRGYANGKAGGRVSPGVRCAGPHYFSYNGNMESKQSTFQVPASQMCVLHFEACTFNAWYEKFKHIGKNAHLGSIPFPYYHDSINAVNKALHVYKTYTQRETTAIPKEFLFNLT